MHLLLAQLVIAAASGSEHHEFDSIRMGIRPSPFILRLTFCLYSYYLVVVTPHTITCAALPLPLPLPSRTLAARCHTAYPHPCHGMCLPFHIGDLGDFFGNAYHYTWTKYITWQMLVATDGWLVCKHRKLLCLG
jgi:hypothetical protein